MKFSFFLLLFVISSFAFAQNNYIVKTEDGRRVLLKADFTWEYIDADNSDSANALIAKESNTCNIAEDFVEPELNNKIQSQLKKGRATIEFVKKKVAKDFNCTEDEVLLLSASEQKAKAVYEFCANGTKVSYKRIGNTIIKSGKLF
ncbi:Protein of unknown function [Flaviramulus basaltis]|uniref:DUF3157 domain-containing protein n=1 Tax=Flaviramulus basaltis TaxID=369401 RepID=A0A1K2IBP4_9FLAO|nr:DUF3157 family protein [Flaviramulus basaltis]SFZ89837.1 Protein of unknown function [Flaviramulus basaltis]